MMRFGGAPERGGYTLTELLIALALVGLLLALGGVGSAKILEAGQQQAYLRECDLIFEKILYHRDRTIMAGNIHGDRVRFFDSRVYFGVYDAQKNEYVYEVVTLEHARLQGYLRGKTLELNPEGTVNIGGQLTFVEGRGKRRVLVVQIGAGRIYMKDE
ncbi:MAG: prepilin-type N-terminal cleavage/methylation domain-containing protein [Eubacterium sp.]|nr:prepilin-type N-terminal cleavage/methylation domain-containing protein [Eubacterium sp.]